VPPDDDPDDEDPDDEEEGEEGGPDGLLELPRSTLACPATDGTVSARPVASRMSDGARENT